MNPNKFNIGSFNLLNLVSPDVPYYGGRRYNKDTYKKKCAWIGSQLDRMKVSLVGFQEIFHLEAIQDALEHSTRLKGANLVTANINGELPRVGLATSFKILDHEVIEEFDEVLDIEGLEVPIRNFSRPVLRASVQLREDIISSVYVVHLKSKRPMLNEDEDRDDPVALARGQARALIRRAAEATALRGLLMEELQNRSKPIILLGDVNDSGLAVTTRIVSGEPPHRRFPQKVKRRIWDTLLYQARDIQARQSYGDFYYTHIHNGHYEALDHIMVSQELVAQNPKRVGRIGYVRIFNDHLIDQTLTNNKIPSWQSDHGQAVASVELREHDDDFSD